MSIKRFYIPGSYYFFTVVTYKRRKFLTDDSARDCLRKAWRVVQNKRPFQTIAFCLLPDHLHCIWKMPDNDSDFSIRWRLIKTLFTKEFNRINKEKYSVGHSQIWQPRFWDHIIRDEVDFWNHINYIHYNPVKHGYVSEIKDWEYSTYHRFVKMGFYDDEAIPFELESIEDLEMMGE